MRGYWIAALGLCGLVAARPAAAANWDALAKEAVKNGPVLAYTTLSPDNWAPILSAFHKKYPNVQVNTLRTGSHAETFERYRAESASGTKTADVLLAVGPDQWDALVKSGDVIKFKVRDIGQLPKFSYTDSGRYTLSADIQVMMYNKLVLPKKLWPTGTADLVKLVKENPKVFDQKIGSYDPTVSPFSYSVYWTLEQHFGSNAFWKNEKVLAPQLRFEQTTGAMTNKTLTGEYVVDYMLPEALVPQPGSQARDVLGVIYPDDGTPVLLREMGVMSKGSNHAGGELLVDFLTSREGQIVLTKAGLTPYLPGIEKEVPRHYDNVVAGAKNADRVALYKWTPKVQSDMKPFRARFKKLVGG